VPRLGMAGRRFAAYGQGAEPGRPSSVVAGPAATGGVLGVGDRRSKKLPEFTLAILQGCKLLPFIAKRASRSLHSFLQFATFLTVLC